MDNTCVDDALDLENMSLSIVREVDLLESDEERLEVLHHDLLHKKKVKGFQVKFRSLKMLSCCFPLWDYLMKRSWKEQALTTTNCSIILEEKKKKNIKALQFEFRLFKILSGGSFQNRCLCSIVSSFHDCDKKLHRCLSLSVSSIENICEKEGIIDLNFTEWNSVAEQVNDKIQECKLQIMKYGKAGMWFLRIRAAFTLNEYMEYIDVLHCYRNVLVEELGDDGFVNFKTPEESLFLVKQLIALSVSPGTWRQSGENEQRLLSHMDFNMDYQRWARKTERIILISWQNEPQENLRDFNLHCQIKYKFDVPKLIQSCFRLIEDDQKLRHSSDSLVFWESVSMFVGFVLENVKFTVRGDVPVLRDGLKVLITFLDESDPSPTNTIMDHSDMSYFQQKLDAVFHQASGTINYFGEAEETIMDLQQEPVKAFLVEFRFLKMLSSGPFRWWDLIADDYRLRYVPSRLSSIITTIEDMCQNEKTGLYGEWIAASTGHENSNEGKSEETKLNHKILDCMAKINNDYGKNSILISLKADDFFTLEETRQYLRVIRSQMNGEFSLVKRTSHIKTLEEILFLLNHLIAFTPWSGQEKYENERAAHLEFCVHHWANKVVSMKLLSNEEQDDEKIPDILQKADAFTPKIIRLCLGFIKVQKLRRSDTLAFWEFVSRFVDFFLENVVFTLEDDDVLVHRLRDGLILLITFLADPPTNTMDHSVLSSFQNKIHAVLGQASHTIGKTNVADLQESVDKVRQDIKKLYVQIDHQSWSTYPRTNGLGHFESLLVYLENLKEAMNNNENIVPLMKHRILTITDELILLQDIWMMQKHHAEMKGMCDQIISLSYQADLAIKSSFIIDHSVWYNFTSLSLIVDKIRDIKNKVLTIKDSHIHGTEVIPPLITSVDVYHQAPTSTCIVDVVVGFKHVTEELIVRLTWGTKNLDIVPIVGMAGIGKTTLAKKLFNEPSIIRHFHKRAFCRVSQAYRKKNVVLDILSDLCTVDDEVRQMSDEDLAHMLWKCLSGCKYLVVMDDIWDIKDWYDMRSSFPNDNIGSRVIFTTRISNIYLTENSVSNSHKLPFLSVDESWELLRLKIFHNDPFPPHLCDLGKLIVEKCGRLPLAIVVIAGLLKRTERSLPHWNEVADSLTAFASSEGCKDVIGLSYQRLPEPLKSCFLYLGVFHEDEKIKAKMLAKLWVAEGFVLESGSKLAKQYLNQLGDTNLVTVTKRSCNGWIKHFHVHDLIRDFCRTEAQEQHYLCFVNSQNSKFSMPRVCDQYRVCIEDEWRSFVDSKPSGPTIHTLLHYSKDYCVARSLDSFLCNFKLVQVLDLQMQVEVDGGFPKPVTTLIHLRYLALRLHMLGIEKVPSEISNLWNLETLLILGIKVQFPSDIWKMKRLRHVETDDDAHVDLDKDDDVSGGLPDLESFISLVIPPGKEGAELLRRLPNVRKLSCLFSGYSWFQTPKLDILTNLESLQIRYIGEGFFRYLHTFTFPLAIRKLTLERFELHWNEFTAVIRKLPALQVLVLRWTTSYKDAKIWDVQDEEFPNIRSLTLEDLDIEEWKATTDSFPHIEKLKLCYCKHLREIPPCFGEVPTLKHVMVRYCNKGVEDSALQIQQDSDDHVKLEVLTRDTSS